MNCPACGADNRDGARFCRRCGGEMDEPLAAEEALPNEETTEGDAEEPTVEEANAKEPPPENKETEIEELAVEAEMEKNEPEQEQVEIEEEDVEVEEKEIVAEVLEENADESESEVELSEPEEPIEVPIPAEWVEEDDDYEPLPEPDDDLLFFRDEVEPLIPAELGAVIVDRYVLVEVLDLQDDEILYRAQDLQRCWQCGFEENSSDDAFCAQCGVSLDRKADTRLLEIQPTGTEPYGDKIVAARLTHEERVFLLLTEPEPEPAVETAPPQLGIRLLVGQHSDVGQLRELNEDSLLTLTLSPAFESKTGPVLGLFAVAEGMGGHGGGGIASKLSLQVLAEQVMRTIIQPELAGELALEEEIAVRLRQATIAANDAVYLARQKSEIDMGTTLTIAFIRDDRLFLAHVGDCRTYRWNADGLEQLTTDHSVVASMVADGRATPEDIYTHPHRSVIYRCIGDKPVVEVDTDILPLALGDRVILCSDGLWEMIRDEGVEDVMMQEAEPQAACDLLVRHANIAGGDDNISVVIVQVEEV